MSTLRSQVQTILDSDQSTQDKRVSLLGRKGLLTQSLKGLKDLPPTQKASLGKELNDLKTLINRTLLTESESKTTSFDLSAPALKPSLGSLHPINIAVKEMVDIFTRLGFEAIEGPEIVTDYDNFGSLHFPADHPARDTQDSFLINDLPDHLLRTQTSAMQVPAMKKRQPPMRVVVPGKTFRREADATHQPMFNQLEGFIVDDQVTFADLKGILSHFIREYFGDQVDVRFRPHYFPFTEPSAEVDIAWQKADGQSAWLEVLGCGMIHPEVLKNAGLNPRKYQGVAFGFGVERPFMLKYGVKDMRLLYDNDENFLSQFQYL